MKKNGIAGVSESRFERTAKASSWRLPSGQLLPEFALQCGFFAPELMRQDLSGKRRAGRRKTTER